MQSKSSLTFAPWFCIQDLKKQTAIRLAQEQQRQGRIKTSSYPANPSEQEVYPIVEDPRSTTHVPTHVPTSHPPVPSLGHGPSYNNSGAPVTAYVHHAPPENMVAPKFDRDVGFHSTNNSSTRSGGWNSSTPRDTAPSTFRGNSVEPSSKQKAKLPHGLTVQELKEMTKARLQAEAADKVDDTRLLRTPEPHAVPSEPRIAPPPTPPYQQGWNSNTREGWERPPGVLQSSPDSFANPDFQEDFDFKRARTYSDGRAGGDGFLSQHGSAPYNHPGATSPSYYDPAMSFNHNRRRAATWSPRLGLSHVQEEYIPERASPMPSIPGNAPCPPGLQARPMTPFNMSNPVGYSFVPNSNRPRTSSAVSLPPMSHTADEFDLEPCLRSSPFGAVREESDTLGLAAVFRNDRLCDMPPVMNDLDFSDGLMDSTAPAGLSDELASLLNLGGPDDE